MSAKKIVIIDDEAHIRMLLEQTLEDYEDQGVELLCAADGKEGLELILTHTPDLVFCDVMMPFMNGYEVCEEVKNTNQLSDTYFILLTAKGQEADREKGEKAGADMYLTKPFDPDQVYDKAAEVLKLSA